MKNTTLCSNCGTENAFYKLNCSKCGALLRGKTVNIDLWSTVWKLIESPRNAFEAIVFSKHKNFTVFILILVSIKAFINTLSIANLLELDISLNINTFIELTLSVVFVILFVLLFALFLKIILKIGKVETRFKDNLSILTYSLMPYILALAALFPVEYAIFGRHWLLFNPSPFMLKSNAATILFGIEGLILLWCLFLSTVALYVQSKNTVFSIVASIFYNLANYLVIYFMLYVLGLLI